MEKRVAFCTLGCKLNFAETSTLSRRFEAAGFVKVPFGGDADVVVVNTCSVTAQADKKCRQAIAKAHHAAPGALIAVVGCYAQLKADEISRLPGVCMVLGTHGKQSLPERVLRHIGLSDADARILPDMCAGHLSGRQEPRPGPFLDPSVRLSYEGAYSLFDRTRSFLKVQDGCDFRCTYCTVPLARGNSRNAPVADIVAAARRIASAGIREIVVTGVNIGDFGKTTGERLIDLFHRLDEVEDIERYRLSSIEPDLLSDELLSFMASSRAFMPHFHIPLQSGCDRTLQRMGRHYRSDVFLSRIDRIRQLMPDAFVAADVIVGFPGESDADFDETCRVLRRAGLAFCHVFPYSERPHTPAASMPGKVPPAVKEHRCHQLLLWAEEQKTAFYDRFSDRVRRVLFESKHADGLMSGFSDNYLKIAVPFEASLIGRTAPVRIGSPLHAGLLGGELLL